MKSQSSKSLTGAYGTGFPTLMSSRRGFDTDCPIVLTASASPDTAALCTVDENSDGKWKSIMEKKRKKQEKISVLYWFFGRKFFASELFKVIQDAILKPTLQDNVVIPSNFFQYIFQIGCAINLHSIMNSGNIPGVQN